MSKRKIRAITPFTVIQGHRLWYQSKVHMRLPISDNTNSRPILHRFGDIAFDRSKIAIFGYHLATLLVFNSPGGGVPLGRSP